MRRRRPAEKNGAERIPYSYIAIYSFTYDGRRCICAKKAGDSFVTMKVGKEISSLLKGFGKPALKSELRDLIIAQWREEQDREQDSGSGAQANVKVSKHEMKEQFQEALDELCQSNKLRISGEGKELYVEYIKKSARRDTAGSEQKETKEEKAHSRSDESSTTLSTTNAKPSKRAKFETEKVEADATRDGAPVTSVSSTSTSNSTPGAAAYPPTKPLEGNNTILLFYAYCTPPMSRDGQDRAIAHMYGFLKNLGVTGRLRIGREGYNSTLTGPHDAMRKFTAELRRYDPNTFRNTDFKYVDKQPDNQLLPALKVFPVSEIVNYGFNAGDAPLELGGTHLKPAEFHKALENPNSVVIDVRNYNEALIGRFQPPENADDGHQKYLDPQMRKSTEFPEWVEKNKKSWEGKQVLMYCTAGVRCERASAFMRNKGVENVFQLEGGIHRYLEAFPEDGGYWKGANYVFDKRFSHGAKQREVISRCVYCDGPWERYNAQQKCFKCKMEVLLCNTCSRAKPAIKKSSLFCPLCLPRHSDADTQAQKQPTRDSYDDFDDDADCGEGGG
jgi:predicted sulfurtransferase